MDVELVLNELSIFKPCDGISAARSLMSTLVKTMVKATSLGASRVLRTDAKVHQYALTSDYPVARWLNDNEVNRDEITFFKSMATKAPLLVDLTRSDAERLASECEFTLEGELAKGLGVAYLIEGLAVSLISEEKWNSSSITLEMTCLDGSGDLVPETVDVAHAGSIQNVLENSDWLKTRRLVPMTSAADLYSRVRDDFPSLSICEAALGQLKDIDSGNPIVKQISIRLQEFQYYCDSWKDGPFDADALPCKVSTDSQSTLKKYDRERTFNCPDGTVRVFSWHARLTPGAWRLYFHPLEDDKKFIIGYVGKKLPTVSDPT